MRMSGRRGGGGGEKGRTDEEVCGIENGLQERREVRLRLHDSRKPLQHRTLQSTSAPPGPERARASREQRQTAGFTSSGFGSA
eukprot:1797030-Rhodomonas_salina.1